MNSHSPIRSISWRVTDAENRVDELWSWPASGAAARVWSINPDAFGWDEILSGSTIYQPLRGTNAGQFYEDDTGALNDSPAALRPPLHLTGGAYYDPLTATVTHVDTAAPDARSYLVTADGSGHPLEPATSPMTPRASDDEDEPGWDEICENLMDSINKQLEAAGWALDHGMDSTYEGHLASAIELIALYMDQCGPDEEVARLLSRIQLLPGVGEGIHMDDRPTGSMDRPIVVGSGVH